MNLVNKLLNFIENISIKIVVYLFMIITLFVSTINLIFTTYFDNKTYKEFCLYKKDSFIITIVVSVILIAGVLYLINKIKVKEGKLIRYLMIYTAILGLIWISMADSYPVADSACIFSMASEFLHGDYGNFYNETSYLSAYPFQIGMVFFIEVMYRIIGEGTYFFPMILNVLCICTIFYFLCKIVKEVFLEVKVSNITAILLFGCLPAIFYCTYVYGTIYGLTLSVIAIYMLIRYYNTDKVIYVFWSSIFIAISIILKSNYSIVLITLIIMLILKAANKRKILPLLLIIVLVTTTVLLKSLLCTYYESRSGAKLREGAPKTLWIAMGLQDGDAAEGWYNGFNWLTFVDNPSYEDSDKIAKESIKQSLRNFKENPKEAFKFFYKKIVSQWSEPTYQSLFSSHNQNQHSHELSRIGKSIYEGLLNKVLLFYMDVYNFIIWMGTFLFLILNRKKINIQQLMCAIIIIGGFLFHIIWEGKSMYIFPYFMFAIPYGAAGIFSIGDFIDKKICKLKNRYSI